ncbi:hypothetical protein A2U01_0023422, partial [Trifolium medium]|nr:hypothetical protein [Trifolium medium]
MEKRGVIKKNSKDLKQIHKKLSQEASTRLEVNTVALRLVRVAVTVVVGRVFVVECVVSNGEGQRLFWRGNIVK